MLLKLIFKRVANCYNFCYCKNIVKIVVNIVLTYNNLHGDEISCRILVTVVRAKSLRKICRNGHISTTSGPTLIP